MERQQFANHEKKDCLKNIKDKFVKGTEEISDLNEQIRIRSRVQGAERT